MEKISLKVLREAFDDWRRKRKGQAHVPASLKAQALSTLSHYSQAQISAATRVSSSTFSNWLAQAANAQSNQCTVIEHAAELSAQSTFVSLPSPDGICTADVDKKAADNNTFIPITENSNTEPSAITICIGKKLQLSVSGYSVEQTSKLLLQLAKAVS